MRTPPEILHHREIARTRIFRIEELELRFANGAEVTFERLAGGAAQSVMVVPWRDDDELLLVREYATGTERYELGFPKGILESGEDPTAGANREIMEEIGFAARELTPLHRFTVSPAYIQHQTHVILARGLYPQTRPGDEPEPPEVVPWPLERGLELLEREDFTDARCIAALLLVLEHWRRES